jgi:hypothetical protein
MYRASGKRFRKRAAQSGNLLFLLVAYGKINIACPSGE